ncbi:MAG: S-adenosylmethionine:tRNA ribosyltransferase-isomerase [Bacteroidota bacterium]
MSDILKKSVEEIAIENFQYDLPDSRIAKYPVEPRDSSKLLIYKKQQIADDYYHQLDKHVPAHSLLIMNNTKVVEARLLFQKESGASIEIFCLEPDDQYSNIIEAMQCTDKVYWKCLVGGAKKWKDEVLTKSFIIEGISYQLQAKKIAQLSDSFIIAFSWDKADTSFAELLHAAGIIPLPPYLKRASEESDRLNYQTIYAQEAGSVAAPTAGLHFTEKVFTALDKNNCSIDFVTLHVGAGTFMPVKSATLADHNMHAEFIDVELRLLQQLIATSYSNIIAVGTTSLRTLESLYWMGVKAIVYPSYTIEQLAVQQWDAYELPQHYTKQEAIEALIAVLQRQSTSSTRIICKTQLLITPMYSVRMVDAILTNFHQPQSTLLLLIAAFVGDDWKSIYAHALAHDYRFLSYGDGSLLWKHSK